MVSGYSRWFRFILILALAAIFLATAYLIFKKQQEKYSFTSFHVQNETAGILIPNIDRLRKKMTSSSDLQVDGLPQSLSSAINATLENHTFRFSEKLSAGCFISYNPTEFLLAFQTNNVSASDLSSFLISDFMVSSTFGETELILADKTYQVAQYNHFLVISSAPFSAILKPEREHYGNADYIVYHDSVQLGDHHILKDFSHHIVRNEKAAGPAGKPLLHQQFVGFVPSSFSSLEFYGSSRFFSDQNFFFNQPDEAAFKWVDGGLILIRKDSFELLIAPQNTEMDLKLRLEEQTLLKRGDTSFIPYFNIGPYEIMPFETTINWQKAIPGQREDFHFFTEIDNFNVLSSSIPAMRWYLGELQLGNLMIKNQVLHQLYSSSLPQRAHCFTIQANGAGKYKLINKIWIDESQCIVSTSTSGGSSQSNEPARLYASFDAQILPSSILTVRQNSTELILLSNTTQVELYDTAGAKLWAVTLTSSLNGFPQIADLENDGIDEIVLFQTDQLNILDVHGNSKPGLPKKFGGNSQGGIVVNYDNSYNYRFLTSVGNQIKSLDEQGQAVQGWMFSNMTTTLQGTISYYVTQGKDMISFKDNNNKQYVINRRGESRLTKEVTVKLPNESPFVVGNYDEASLRKLGYQNNYIYNSYLLDGQKDSVKLDRPVNALLAYWIFNNNQPLLVIEESERVVVIDEFGYEKESVLKPIPNQQFGGLVIGDSFKYVFVDNSENALYLLDGFGKMIFPLPVKGSRVFHLNNNLLYTATGTRINVYQTD